ncbi:hypothetical protein X975_11709, partial [Stegodyphus mimosarum]
MHPVKMYVSRSPYQRIKYRVNCLMITVQAYFMYPELRNVAPIRYLTLNALN